MKSQWKLAVVGALLCFASSVVEAAQYFAPRYTVMDSGQIQPSLAVRFNGGQPCVIKAQLHGAAGSGKILVLGWPEGNSVGLCTFQNSVEYALYKLTFRPGKEDLLVLGYGKRGTGKTRLEELSIIGADSLGKIRQLPVSGFIPEEVFNSPLQIRQDQAVLFLDPAPRVMALQAAGTDGYSVSQE